MFNSNWNDGGFGWLWLVWMVILLLSFSGFGIWGYTYRSHRKLGMLPRKKALDILNERDARGDIEPAQTAQMRSDLATTPVRIWISGSDRTATRADRRT
jgi:putative membrane protein